MAFTNTMVLPGSIGGRLAPIPGPRYQTSGTRSVVCSPLDVNPALATSNDPLLPWSFGFPAPAIQSLDHGPLESWGTTG